MRIALSLIVVIVGVTLGNSIIQNFSELQDQRQDQFCQVDPIYCK